jgi:hypothetical protein
VPNVAIKPTDVGKRITVQFFHPDGSREEAVGMFERAEVVEGTVVFCIRRRDDSLVRVPLNRIRAGKVVG